MTYQKPVCEPVRFTEPEMTTLSTIFAQKENETPRIPMP